MKAVILAIGSELLQGFLNDTNSTYLAQELTALGVEVVGISGVGDDLDMIIRCLSRALDDADIVVCTGGIGPTSDDLTREAVAAICNEVPEVDADTLEVVRSFFTRRDAVMPERNAKQAWHIPSAEILANPVGTAPGWFVRHSGSYIIIMPGVPREMMPMWSDQAVPRLLPAFGGDTITSRTLKTIGVGESAVEDMLSDIIARKHPAVSTYAKNDGVHIRIVAITGSGSDSRRAVETTEQEIRTIMGTSIYGDLNTSLPAAALEPLLKNQSTLAILESGTGGQVSALLLSDSKSEQVVVEGRVVRFPADEQHAEPRTTRASQVERMRTETGATHALGVTVSLFEADDLGRFDASIDVTVVSPERRSSNQQRLSGRPSEIGRRASLFAAEKLRHFLLDPRAGHSG